MKLKYFGTAAAEGLPGLYCSCPVCEEARKLGGKNIRTRSQALVDDDLLLDFPADTYLHVLRDGLDLRKVKNLLISHSHEDHCYMSDVMMRSEPYSHGTDAFQMNVYGNSAVGKKLQVAVEEEAFPKLPDVLTWTEAVEFKPFMANAHKVTPLLALHAQREKCLIYMIERDGKRLLYCHDTGFFPQETWDYIKGIRFDAVSMDCTHIVYKDGGNHMGIEDNRIMKERLTEIGCADENTIFVINHFSHNGTLNHDAIVKAVEKDGFIVSYDGLEIEF